MTEVMIPDGLPTLSAGSHREGEGKACVMELVSVIAGESWSDKPMCVHPMLRAASIVVNDMLDDEHRNLMVPVMLRLFGTNKHSRPARRAMCEHLMAQVTGSPTIANPDEDLPVIAFRQRYGRRTNVQVMGQPCSCSTCMASVYHLDSGDLSRLGRSQDAVQWLHRLVDVYDVATGRTAKARTITPEEVTHVRRMVVRA